MGRPVTRDMYLSNFLVLVHDAPPVIDSFVDAEGGDLHPELTDHLIGSDNVLSPHLKHDVIANVLDVNIKHFLEGRALTLIVPGLCLELLHARSDLTEGVHSAEDIGITDESSLKNVELEVAWSRAGVAGRDGDRSLSFGGCTTHRVSIMNFIFDNIKD
jgi:hypothetical protein